MDEGDRGLRSIGLTDKSRRSDTYAGMIFACVVVVCITAIVCCWILR